MSGAVGDDASVHAALRARLESGLQRIAYFVIPSVVAFVALGGVLASALYEGGAFTRDDAKWVWGALMGSAVGLLAGTMGRLYASASFALRDTTTPFRFALLRVAVAAVLGTASAIWLPRLLQVDSRWGIAVLTAASGIAGWLEFLLLRRHIARRIGAVGLPKGLAMRVWGCAVIAAAVAVLVVRVVQGMHPVAVGVLVCGAYGAVYLGVTRWTGVDRARRA
jgi:putative peptidoglycan lipid II flippase